MRIVPLDVQRHDRKAFTCGHDGLDQYLQRYARQAIRNGLARVYVAEGEQGAVLGYYTLSAASVRQQDLPPDQARALPRYPVPAVLIGRMASHTKAREMGQRIGSRLLIHALKQALRAADTIGVQCVIVDSKPEAVDFYRRFGFLPLLGDGLKLYLPIGTILKMEMR